MQALFRLIINILSLPLLIIAIPLGIARGLKQAKLRTTYTEMELRLFEKAQRAIDMDERGALSPDKDILSVARYIESTRNEYEKRRNQDPHARSPFLREFAYNALSVLDVDDWTEVLDYYRYAGFEVDLRPSIELAQWLNQVTQVEPEQKDSSHLFMHINTRYQPKEIYFLEQLVLGRYDAGHGIRSVPANISAAARLRSLHLQNNELVELPEEISMLHDLEVLKLGGNPLRSLPSSIGKLKKLRILTLWRNESLIELPQEIGQLTQLEGLDIHDCTDLQHLPESICELKQLKRFYYSAELVEFTDRQLQWLNELERAGAELEYPR